MAHMSNERPIGGGSWHNSGLPSAGGPPQPQMPLNTGPLGPDHNQYPYIPANNRKHVSFVISPVLCGLPFPSSNFADQFKLPPDNGHESDAAAPVQSPPPSRGLRLADDGPECVLDPAEQPVCGRTPRLLE